MPDGKKEKVFEAPVFMDFCPACLLNIVNHTRKLVYFFYYSSPKSTQRLTIPDYYAPEPLSDHLCACMYAV